MLFNLVIDGLKRLSYVILVYFFSALRLLSSIQYKPNSEETWTVLSSS